jgi:hypothetical protein
MENPAFENAQPARGELEALSGDDGRVPAVSPAEATALRLRILRDV